MDGQGLIQSMTAHLNQLAASGGGGGGFPIPSTLPPHLFSAGQAPNIPPRLDPQATAMFNARLEMLNSILINQLMSVAGLPAPPPVLPPPERPPVAHRTGERIGGNTVAPPSIMRQQARREREALQREARGEGREGRGGGGGRQNRSYNQDQQQQNQYRGQVTFHKKIDDDSGILSSATKSSDDEGTSAKIERAHSRIITDEDRAEIIARLTDAIVQWFLNHYNITESDVDAVPKAAVWDKARMHLPLELGKRVFFNQLMKGLKMQGKRIRIKNSMVLRVRMKENLKPIEEEGSNIGDETLSTAAAEAAAVGAGAEEEANDDEEDQPQQEKHAQKNEYNEKVASQMDRELKRCLGLLTDDTPAKKERVSSVDAEVQADIGEEPLQLLPKDVVRTKAMAAGIHKQNMSPSSADANLQDRSLIPWHQITSTPSLLQGKPDSSQMPQELTPIMAASGRTNSLSEKASNSGSMHSKRSGSLEHSIRSRGSTGSQRRPQRPAKRLRSRESRSSRSSLAQLKADSAPETETSMDASHSSGVFSSDNPSAGPQQQQQLDTTASASDSELCRRGDYGRHNIAQFLSTIQTPNSPLPVTRSVSSRSLCHDSHMHHDKPATATTRDTHSSLSERRPSTCDRRHSLTERRGSTSDRRPSTAATDKRGATGAGSSERPGSSGTGERRASSSDWRGTGSSSTAGEHHQRDWPPRGAGSGGHSGDWRSSTADRRSSATDWRPNSSDRRSSASDWRSSGERRSSASNWRANRSHDSDHSRTEHDPKHDKSPSTVDGKPRTHKPTSPHTDGKARKSIIDTHDFLSVVKALFDSLRSTKTDISNASWTIKSLALHNVHVQCGQLAFKSIQENTSLKDLGDMKRSDLTSDLSSSIFWGGDGSRFIAVYQEADGALWVPIAVLELKEKATERLMKTSPPPKPLVKPGEGIDEVDDQEKKVEKSQEISKQDPKKSIVESGINLTTACKIPLPEETENLEVCLDSHSGATGNVDVKIDAQEDQVEEKYHVELVMVKTEKLVEMELKKITERKNANNDRKPDIATDAIDANKEEEVEKKEFGETDDKKKRNEMYVELQSNSYIKEESCQSVKETNNKEVTANDDDSKTDDAKNEDDVSTEERMNKANDMKTAEVTDTRDLIEESYKTLELEITDELAKEMADSILSFKAMHGYWQKLGDSLNDSPDHHHGRKHEKSIEAVPKLATASTVSDMLQRGATKPKPKEEVQKIAEEIKPEIPKEPEIVASKSDNEELWDLAMSVTSGKLQTSTTSDHQANMYSSFESLDAEVAANTQEESDEGVNV